MDQEMLDRAVAVTTAEGTLAHRMGIKVLSASGSEVVATMPVAGNTQPFGLLHGGASCVLAETIGSLGAALHAGLGRVVVGIEISATHHRGAMDGDVTAVWPTEAGRSPPMRSSLPTRPATACARPG
jgi:1,4-dihydroxy-2-naphthoyl-CoA hydrolase